MGKLLLKNIRSLINVRDKAPVKLCGSEMSQLPCLEDAWLACDEGKIAAYGEMSSFPGISDWNNVEVMDCNGRLVLPCFVDSHTHIVYAGDRAGEFVDRIKGFSYEQIASRGGGILNSAQLLRKTSEDELFEQSKHRLREIISQGTGAVEIKSGYGLDLESELKMLRVIRRLAQLNWIPVKATFLGAHAVPAEFRSNKKGYLGLLTDELLPVIASEKLADFIDIFCEKNYFDSEDTTRILDAGVKFGLKGKVHAEQLSHSGGIQAGVRSKAISVDHLEFCNDEDIVALKASETMPVILPGAAFFLNLPFPPARKIIEAGLPLAIASDYNPGSSPSGNMRLMMSIACIQYKLTPEEAINASTINGAYAMDMTGKAGCISAGLPANLIVTKEMVGYSSLVYAYGSDHIEKVILNGKYWE